MVIAICARHLNPGYTCQVILSLVNCVLLQRMLSIYPWVPACRGIFYTFLRDFSMFSPAIYAFWPYKSGFRAAWMRTEVAGLLCVELSGQQSHFWP